MTLHNLRNARAADEKIEAEHGLDAEAIAALHRAADETVKPRASLADVAQGFVSARPAMAKDACLTRACADQRLSETHLRVLVYHAHCMGEKSGVSFPSDEIIGAVCGLAPKTVQNVHSDLVRWQYLVRADARRRGEPKGHTAFVPPAGMSWAELKKLTASPSELIAFRNQIAESIGKSRNQGNVNPATREIDGDAFPGIRETISLLGNAPVAKPRKMGVPKDPLSIEEEQPQVNNRTVKGPPYPQTPECASGREALPSGRNSAVVPTRVATVPKAPNQAAMPLDGTLSVDGLDMPVAIKVSISKVAGTTNGMVAVSGLVEAIRAARMRGVPDSEIISDMAKAATQAAADADKSGQQVTPLAILKTAQRWLPNSRVPSAAKPDPFRHVRGSSGQWTRAGNLIRDEDMPDFSKLRPIGDLSEVE